MKFNAWWQPQKKPVPAADSTAIINALVESNRQLQRALNSSKELMTSALATNRFLNDRTLKLYHALYELVLDCESTDMIILQDSVAYQNAKEVLAGPKKQ